MPNNAGVAWDRVGGVLLVVHASRQPTDAEWAEFVASPACTNPSGAVVVSNGVRPTPKQRAQIQESLGALVDGTAVLTDSLLSRGAVTALAWFGVRIRAFSTTDKRAALAYAGVPETDTDSVLQLLDAMSDAVATPKRQDRSA